MTSWKTDTQATRAARDAFPEHAPRVFCHGEGQYLLLPTPYGRMELIAVQEGYLVAAERPPEPPGGAAPNVPEPLVRHLLANGLRAWKTVPSREPAEVIRSLGLPTSTSADPGYAASWSPLLSPLATTARRVGEARDALAADLGNLIGARRPGDPLPELLGPDGVGKRTLAATLAADRGWTAIELPLARVLVERVFQTPIECFLELVLAAADRLGGSDLLAVSDAEVLHAIEGPRRQHMLRELARLPRVCLLARPSRTEPPEAPSPAEAGLGAREARGVVALNCPGLQAEAEARALTAAEMPDVSFEGACLDLLARAASLPGVGVIPGRLLYLVRLAVARLEADGGAPLVLAPDEAANVIPLARAAWAVGEAAPPAAEAAF